MNNNLYNSIRARSRVSIVGPGGKVSVGRAVMKGPAGWVLNMGGPHGRPAIASPSNVVAVKA